MKQRIRPPDGCAVFGGPRNRYRYLLTRDLRPPELRGAPPSRRLAFIMLNPSTATAVESDPTIRRCIGFARTLSFDFLEVGNLFALRATLPRELLAHPAPIGPENDAHLDRLAARASMVLCGWGNAGAHQGRARGVVERLTRSGVVLHALKVNHNGEPAHPLYLRGDLEPFALAAGGGLAQGHSYTRRTLEP